MPYEAIVIGVSSGGLNAMRLLFSRLPPDFTTPLIIVQHVGTRSDTGWINFLNSKSHLHIKEADEKELIEKGKAYFAPPNYHLQIERDKTLSLSIHERVSFARPSIDVLFESAAEAYRDNLIGIVLTGSNNDGTSGIRYIQKCGGLTIVQDPSTSESPFMPKSAIKAIRPDYVISLEELPELICRLVKPVSLSEPTLSGEQI